MGFWGDLDCDWDLKRLPGSLDKDGKFVRIQFPITRLH